MRRMTNFGPSRVTGVSAKMSLPSGVAVTSVGPVAFAGGDASTHSGFAATAKPAATAPAAGTAITPPSSSTMMNRSPCAIGGATRSGASFAGTTPSCCCHLISPLVISMATARHPDEPIGRTVTHATLLRAFI